MSETNKDEGKGNGKAEPAAEGPTIEQAQSPVAKWQLPKPRPVPDECLRAIGRIAVEWTHLEKTLGELFCHLVGIALHERIAVVTHIPLPTQIDIVKAYASQRKQISDTLKEELKGLLNEVDEKRRGRNQAIHGEWQVYPAAVLLSITSARGKIIWRGDLVKPAELESFADEIISLNDRLSDLAWRLAGARGA